MREQVLQEVILNICQIQVELDSLPSLGEKDQLTSKQLQGDLASLNTRINEFGATIASAVKQLAPLEKQFHLCSTLND